MSTQAGDVANHLPPAVRAGPGRALQQRGETRRAAARSMLGSTAPYDYLYTFWSDQYEHKIEYVGHVTGGTSSSSAAAWKRAS